GVDLHRHVVARDHVLRWHFIDDDAQVDADHLLHERHQQDESRSLGAGVAPQCENDAPFVFPENTNGGIEKKDRERDNDHSRNHGFPPCSAAFLPSSGCGGGEGGDVGSTITVSPSRAITLTRAPGWSGMAERARQISLRTRTRPSAPCQNTTSPSAPRSASA